MKPTDQKKPGNHSVSYSLSFKFSYLISCLWSSTTSPLSPHLVASTTVLFHAPLTTKKSIIAPYCTVFQQPGYSYFNTTLWLSPFVVMFNKHNPVSVFLATDCLSFLYQNHQRQSIPFKQQLTFLTKTFPCSTTIIVSSTISSRPSLYPTCTKISYSLCLKSSITLNLTQTYEPAKLDYRSISNSIPTFCSLDQLHFLF